MEGWREGGGREGGRGRYLGDEAGADHGAALVRRVFGGTDEATELN